MEGITIREDGTDSPNVGTITASGGRDSIFNNVENGVLRDKLEDCLVRHYDANVRIPKELPLERIKSKGSGDLTIQIEGAGAWFETQLVLELTWVY
tara:strand:- start:2636 stop:2923 length:288 start_codon:yes stop_codon:yes gene_type:complete